MRIVWVLGVDLNVRYLAAISTGETYLDALASIDYEIRSLKKQIKEEKDPYKKELGERSLSSKRSYLYEWAERIGARIVHKACSIKGEDDCVIVFEDLNFDKLNVSEEVKNTWKKLIKIVEESAPKRGIEVSFVSSHYTSTRCINCGKRSEISRYRDTFHCPWCGYEGNADVVAAINIGINYILREYGKNKEVLYKLAGVDICSLKWLKELCKSNKKWPRSS